jgi:SAM-dependent methyltransferase
LTRHVGRVVAVDIYGSGRFADGEASADFPVDPASAAPYGFVRDRLDIRVMDARRLEHAAESFDAVVSLSSLEHFGTSGEIASAAREIARVLKPGGHAFVVTETFVARHIGERVYTAAVARATRLGARTRLLQRPGREILTVDELQEYIVAASGLRLMQPLALGISRQTGRNVLRSRPGGTTVGASPYPHVLLRGFGMVFTSVSLPLEKPG